MQARTQLCPAASVKVIAATPESLAASLFSSARTRPTSALVFPSGTSFDEQRRSELAWI